MAIKGLEIEGRSPSINSGCSISLLNLRFGRNWQRREMTKTEIAEDEQEVRKCMGKDRRWLNWEILEDNMIAIWGNFYRIGRENGYSVK